MATVTGYTAARMQEIEDGSIVGGEVVGDDLVLTRRDGGTITAGPVVGPAGPTGPSGGVEDHGLLTGLADDDHPQYHNNARGDARYPLIADIDDMAKIASGTYTGDDTSPRTIALPFTPKIVFISILSGALWMTILEPGNPGITSGAKYSSSGTDGDTDNAGLQVGLVTNGFRVGGAGYDVGANGDGFTYNYTAIG